MAFVQIARTVALLGIFILCNGLSSYTADAAEPLPEIIGCPVTAEFMSPASRQEVEAAIAEASQAILARKLTPSAITVPPQSITIPVRAVIIRPADAALIPATDPLPTIAEVVAQIDAINTASRNGISITGSTPSGVDAATPFLYKLCRNVDLPAPNDAWYAAATVANNGAPTPTMNAIKTALRVGGRQTLNMYIKPVWRCTVNAANGPLDDCPAGQGRGLNDNGSTARQFAGIATFPWSLNAGNAALDGVFVHSRQLPGQHGAGWWGGDGLGHPGGSHEVGHWQGLLHTFEDNAVPGQTNGGACTADAPPTLHGDACPDTPPMNNPDGADTFDCVPFAACPGDGCPNTCPEAQGANPILDPNYNHMNYLRPRCHREYTDDQATRMEASYNTWRRGNPNNVLNVALPVATNDAAKTRANTPIQLSVLANDVTALDANDLQVDRITAEPAHGTAVVAADARSIVYTPAKGFAGIDTFRYTVFDCNGVGNEATVTVEVQPAIECHDKVVQLPQAGTCVDAALPADAVTDASGVGYTLFPPGPYKPGINTISATPNDGGPTCTVTFNVLACPPIKCNGVTKSLAYGFCDDIAVPSGELWSGGPVGTKVSGFPTGPFIPGATKVTLTPTEPIGLESCTSTVTVIPCKAVCTDKTVNTDPGVCVASSVSIIDLKSVGKTALAAPDTTKQTPPAPYALGETSPVSVVVNYLGGLVSAASDPACRVTVRDVELPSVAAVKSCLYPKGHSYSKRTHCFPVPELATLADNCPNARLDVMSCKLVGSLPKHIKNKVVPCTVKPDAQSLCVSLDYLDHSTPRTIRAIVRGTDTSGNFAEAETTVKIYKKKPHTGRNKSCKLV